MTDYLTTRELAELLRIKERKVYDLAASGKVPCSKVTGKLLFPRAEIEAWLADGKSRNPARHSREPLPNVVLGSHDPLLEWALRESQSGLAAYFDGSADGLDRFAAGEGIAAGLHLYDGREGTWNVTQVAERFGDRPVVLVEWAVRQRGLIVDTKLAGKVSALNDIAGLRMAARQPEAGAQQLFAQLSQEVGLEPDALASQAVFRSETEAALAVLEDKADVGFGLQSLAEQYRLAFVPIIEERYDLLIDRRAWFEPPMQTFLRFCAGRKFKARAAELAGYNVSGFARVRFNASSS